MNFRLYSNELVKTKGHVPLNEDDVHNLNVYFSQNGITDHLNQDVNKLLKMDQKNSFDPPDFSNKAIYNLMVSQTYEALHAFQTSVQELYSQDAYSGLCEELSAIASKKQITATDVCLNLTDASEVKDILSELKNLQEDSFHQVLFENTQLKYSDFKDCIDDVRSHVLSEMQFTEDQQFSVLESDYSEFSTNLSNTVNSMFKDVYLPIQQSNLQDDFRGVVAENLNSVKNFKKHQEAVITNDKSNLSFEP